MLAISPYDVVLWVHVVAVVIAFGGIFTYPLWVSALREATPEQRVILHELQGRIGRFVISPFLLLIILAGAYLATDRELWSEVWVTVPLVIAIALGAFGGAYFAPKERKLAELATSGQEAEYGSLLRQWAMVAYLNMALVLVAAFFMVTKLGS